jgi:protein arginine N-methyltransferase 1
MNYYRELLRQRDRIEPFRRAIHDLVGPEDRVLEVGTGVGTYSFFAADAGAGRVWAVDGDPVVHVAETIAKLNGYTDRIEFVRGWIPEVALPERATALIFEDFPPRLLDARTHRLLTKLREKYLGPDARMLPGGARLYAAPVKADSGMASPLLPIEEGSESAYGIDWSPTREYVANTAHHLGIPSDAICDPPAVMASLAFDRVPDVEEIGGTASWTYEQDTVISGIAYWFDLLLAPDIRISNAPGVLPGSWGQLLLPIDPPLRVPAGECIDVGVRPERLRDGAPGWLSWWARVGEDEVRGHEFASLPASVADLYEESPDAVPILSEKGRREVKVLSAVDGVRSVSEIARELSEATGGLTEMEALGLVVGALKSRVEVPDITGMGTVGGQATIDH